MALNKRKILWLLLGSLALIAALLYASHVWWLFKFGASPQPVPSAILDIDRTFKDFPPGFPPDPGEPGKLTIQGIDSDRDGVRDDVQRWIYAFVPNEPKKQKALRQDARYYQMYALADDYGPEVIARSLVPLDRAIQCIHLVFAGKTFGYAEGIYLRAKVLNTFRRVERNWNRQSHAQGSGGT